MQIDSARMYRVSTIAQMLDVSASTIYRAIDSGALPAVRIGSTVRVTEAALSVWLAAAGLDVATDATAEVAS